LGYGINAAADPGLYPGLQRQYGFYGDRAGECRHLTADGVKIHALDSKVINIKPGSAKDWNKYDRIRQRA
jgi:hypothetical protein